MKLYDTVFECIQDVLKGHEPQIFPYVPDALWPQGKEFEMIPQSKMKYELGSGKRHSANMTCITENEDYINDDSVYVYGPDLLQITEGTDYVRISEILFKEGEGKASGGQYGTGKLYHIIQDIDCVKYHIYTKGFMLRTSGQSVREQVRVSRQALCRGITFSRIGNTMISQYKKNPYVGKARVIFVTAKDIDYSLLEMQAKRAMDIKSSLSIIKKGLPTECASCSIKEICNEVEGLRELHFGKKEKTVGGMGGIV